MKRRTSSTIPFGYKLEDNFLVEIPEELEALEEIKKHVKEHNLSLREGAEWLFYKTGRPLSHVGLQKIIAKDERLGS